MDANRKRQTLAPLEQKQLSDHPYKRSGSFNRLANEPSISLEKLGTILYCVIRGGQI